MVGSSGLIDLTLEAAFRKKVGVFEEGLLVVLATSSSENKVKKDVDTGF